MEETTLRALLIFLFSSSFLCQIHADYKQTEALSDIYRAKSSLNSDIDNSHLESPKYVNKGNVFLPQEGTKKNNPIVTLITERNREAYMINVTSLTGERREAISRRRKKNQSD
ncbi:hypothetical protein L2E82_14276 [Cichorium intybus]|uniref:Uncharacterized protein n=1 Tax=Cichorium intybus TaxID=13427 RepID=A0ACB9EZH7_CICIN|nr:hypothetical protein L2E82_14276 [Cichorium intybus]